MRRQPVERGRGGRGPTVALWTTAFLEISARVGGTAGQRVGNGINHEARIISVAPKASSQS
jgi:hypothetical protein